MDSIEYQALKFLSRFLIILNENVLLNIKKYIETYI